MQEPILRVTNVVKRFARRSSAMRKRLEDIVAPTFFGLRPKSKNDLRDHEFWAVRNVSFDLHRGEAIGVIGLNGSGKTTLLRMLAGQILPDAGEILVKGKTASMIDLQAGFQASASGASNIFLRAAALGFSREQTRSMLKEIIEFSELGDAIDAPMSSYSAGMKMRLAFSVMAMVQPDILFIDEVLAVGDFRFRQKCLARIREMRDRSAFVFVSHSMGDVKRFCDRVIVLHKGVVAFEGSPDDAIEFYEAINESEKVNTGVAAADSTLEPRFSNEDAITNVSTYWTDKNGTIVEQIKFGDDFLLNIEFLCRIDIRNLIVGVPVWNVNSHYLTGLSTEITTDKFSVGRGETVHLQLRVFGGYLNPGVIKSTTGIVDGVEFLFRMPNTDLEIQNAPHPTWGGVTIPHEWTKLEVANQHVLQLDNEQE